MMTLLLLKNSSKYSNDIILLDYNSAPYSFSFSVGLVDEDDVEHEILILNNNGSFTYDPETDFIGEDTFTKMNASDTATVTMTSIDDN